MMGKVILFISTTIVLFGALSHDVTASYLGCPPDPWFSFRIDFDKSTLPPGVEFITQHDPVHVRGYELWLVSLKNTGSTPLYLIRVPDPSKPVYSYPNSELPPLVIPRHKLVDGKAYYYSTYPFEYKQNAPGDAAYELNVNQEELSQMGVKILNVYKDDRPGSTTPPQIQNFQINAYYGNQPITIKGEIVYALNNDYDPKAKAKCWERRGKI